jgi:hypothetical protein
MKKLKFVKTFESFKINEEVPYNYDSGSTLNKTSKWSTDERRTLEELGSDEIGIDYAEFIEKNGLKITVRKVDVDSSVISSPSYQLKSSISELDLNFSEYYNRNDEEYDFMSSSTGYWIYKMDADWKSFLNILDEFMKYIKDIDTNKIDDESHNLEMNDKDLTQSHSSNTPNTTKNGFKVTKDDVDEYGDIDRFNNNKRYKKSDVDNWKNMVNSYREAPTSKAPMEEPIRRPRWWE